MSKIKFVLDNGTEMSKTETIHYLLQQNKALRERLDALEKKSEFTFPFLSETANNVAAQEVPFTLGGEDIITFNELDYRKVNDSWLD